MFKYLITLVLLGCSGCIFSISHKELRCGIANDTTIVTRDGHVETHQNTLGIHIKWWP